MPKQATRNSDAGQSHLPNGHTMSATAAGLVGAVAGAAVGIALSNKDTRDQITRFITDVKDKSLELKDRLQEEAGDMKKDATKLLDQTQDLMEERDIKSRTDNLKASHNSK
jgi:hypothetical protein